MKMKKSILAGIVGLAVVFSYTLDADAQYGRTKARPDKSQRAVSGQVIGVDTEITFVYHRPNVNGREVWGTSLAAYDKPWRTGANETTIIEVSDDVTVNGEKLAAGKYGLHVIPRASGKWTIIINKDWETWGSFSYKEENDALRIDVDAEDTPNTEQLTFSFSNVTDGSAVASLRWEKKSVSIMIEVAE